MDGYKVTPLSQWGKSGPAPATPAFKADPNLDMKTEPMVQVTRISATAAIWVRTCVEG